MRTDCKCICLAQGYWRLLCFCKCSRDAAQVAYFVDAGYSHWDLLLTPQKSMGLACQIAEPEMFPILISLEP